MAEPTHHFREVVCEPPDAVQFKHPTPILCVDAMGASIAYYVERLGFQLAWDWGDPPTFACIKRGDLYLFLSERSQGQRGTWIFVPVTDVDRLYDEYRVRGANVVQPPLNQPWGSREMKVEDPDGHTFRFAGDPTSEPAR